MLLTQSSINRLGIFFFYDSDGVVDDYVPTLLAGFKPHFSEMTIVCNGKLNEAGQSILSRYTDNLIIRPNTGFDVWAYKTALDSYGWEKLEQFDEIVLFNATIMGPVYPFAEMFETMNKRDLDFWGITKFHKVPQDPFGRSRSDIFPSTFNLISTLIEEALCRVKSSRITGTICRRLTAIMIPLECMNRYSLSASLIWDSSGTFMSIPMI